ncbi:unnamed protein product, partial [Closterium sp. NIES-54]
MALEARAGWGVAKGWFSVGWSRDGEMFPADAIVGNLPGGNAQMYSMRGEDAALVVANASIALGANWGMVTRQDGTKIIKFARRGTDGLAPVNMNGPNTLIWAYAADGTSEFAFHGENVGTATADMSCRRAEAEEPAGGAVPAPTPKVSPVPPEASQVPTPKAPLPLPPKLAPGAGMDGSVKKESSTGGLPGAGTPKPNTPGAGTPAVGTPAVGTPAVGTPAVGTPGIGTSGVGTTVGGAPVGGAPAVGTPGVGTPGGGTPDGRKPQGCRESPKAGYKFFIKLKAH